MAAELLQLLSGQERNILFYLSPAMRAIRIPKWVDSRQTAQK